MREIAGETIGLDDTRESLIRGLQRHVEVDEPEEEDTLELMAGAIMAGEDGESGQPPPARAAVAAAPIKPEAPKVPEAVDAAAPAEATESPEEVVAAPEADDKTGAGDPEKSE